MSQSVSRAIAALKTMGERPTTLGDLAQGLGVHKSTVLRLLQTLEAGGFARRRQDGTYAVGRGLIRLADTALESFDLRHAARPHLLRLSSLCGHTVHLATYVDGEVVYIDKIEGRASVRMASRIGQSAVLHTAAVAKAVMANLEPTLVGQDLISRISFVRHTPQTITSRQRYLDELAEVRRRGFAQDDGEYEDFVMCVAAAIPSTEPYAMSAVSISAPRMLLTFDDLRSFVPDLLDTVRDIAHDLGSEQS
jgi:DNA-binding IclR family transcriptional regulator